MNAALSQPRSDAANALVGIRLLIDESRRRFAELLQRAATTGPMTLAQYQRYLSMQYHFTKGVQAQMLRAAAHRDLAKRKSLRKFLFNFANEEEQHYLVAAKDLAQLDLPILPMPLDVMLWHLYVQSILDEKPFQRLGTTCVLENIAGGAARSPVQQALRAPFLNPANTRFLVIHQHELLPHGDQIMAALEAAQLEPSHVAQLETGARIGMVFYLRMAEWALFPDGLSARCDLADRAELNLAEEAEIATFDESDLTPSGNTNANQNGG